ncbi:protein SUPPRESSOR OFSILENCING 3 [Sesamum angolense]|uniref:Protein SUPPRESSOR OFSILENCING 3 n=1 Tax=Sesamum angolense TaxID=2727404 RepID=A0AAE2C512_9LAMI|nr:protein SUPPRESSOR OFSILENCING 3 [Sesamum angolense]
MGHTENDRRALSMVMLLKWHQGMSALIFDASAVGYTEAERLSKHFEDTCVIGWLGKEIEYLAILPGRKTLTVDAWQRSKIWTTLTSILKVHKCLGKSNLRHEMRSCQEMFLNQMKHMNEDNQQLIWFRNKVAEEQMSKKALEESYGILTEKLWELWKRTE